MRRADREIQSFEEMVDVISRCDVCRLGLHDGDYPYILPLNFGAKIETEAQTVTLYFHSALEGHKIELIRKKTMHPSRWTAAMNCSTKRNRACVRSRLKASSGMAKSA